MKQRINIKPMSVNNAWQGRRFKSPEYKAYEKELLYLLGNKKCVDFDRDKPVSIVITWGFSSAASDIDNPVKPLMDVLQKKYCFNDNKIYEMHLYREQVGKGGEYLEFEVLQINP